MIRLPRYSTITAAALIALVTVLGACDKLSGDGLTPYQRAEKQLAASLLVPPGATYRDAQVFDEPGLVILSFESMEKTDAIAAFYSKAREQKNFRLIAESTSGISYIDDQGRQIGIMYFPRDPDIFKINSVIKISVQPVPKDMLGHQKAEEKK